MNIIDSYIPESWCKSECLMKQAIKHSQFLKQFTNVYEEVVVGKTRADMLIINNNDLIILELKSDKDTLIRLKKQLEEYEKVANKVYIVASFKHKQSLIPLLNNQNNVIGCYLMDSKGELILFREAKENNNANVIEKLKLLDFRDLKNFLISKNEFNITSKSPKDYVFKNIKYWLDEEELESFFLTSFIKKMTKN